MGIPPELHFHQTVKISYLDSVDDTVDFLKQLREWGKIEKWIRHHSYHDIESYNKFKDHLKSLKRFNAISGLPNLNNSEEILRCFLRYNVWAKSNDSDNIDNCEKNNNTEYFEQSNTVKNIRTFFEQSLEAGEDFRTDFTAMESWIANLLRILPYPLTVIYDPYYVDRVYRDEFYRYYASKHFAISRNCRRLTFIHNIYSDRKLLSSSERTHKAIEQDLIGMVVLKPTGTIGRALIDPFKICLPPCYVRTTKFEITVMGKIYSLNAFPSSGQDSEMMTCAEVNVWQIMEYFGSRYRDYKALLPGEMLDCLKNSSEVSSLPSDGLTADQEAYIFIHNGLSPRVYYSPNIQEGQEHTPDKSAVSALSFDCLLYTSPSPRDRG